MSSTSTGDVLGQGLHRVHRAIVVVDLVEAVRAMADHEDAVIEQWQRFTRVVRARLLPEFRGQLVKSLGDGMLMTFDDVRMALPFAFGLDAALQAERSQTAGIDPLRLRMGLNAAAIVVDDLDIYGQAVNLAARLATLAGPGELVASADAVDQIIIGLDADVEDLGDCFLKHIEQPVRAYRLSTPRKVALALGVPQSPANEIRTEAAELKPPRLAVLTLDGEAETAAFRSLVADEIAVQLSVHRSVQVISRLSVRHGDGVNATELLKQVSADYAVGGSCRVDGDNARLTVELMFVPDKHVLWTDATRASVQDTVADPSATVRGACSEVMEAIAAHETGRARSLPLASLDSYAMLVGGVRLMHRLSRADFERAQEILDALASRHPRHPDAFAWLAMWHILQVHQGWSSDPRTSAAKASDMARRSLDKDDRCGVALVVSGMVRTYNDRKLDEAEHIYQSALDANPSNARAWLLKGTLHAFRGEGALAVQHTRHACALSPLDPMRYYFDSLAASAEAAAGNYERAVTLARRSLRANSMHASTLRILTIAHAMQGQIDEARESAQRMLSLEPGFTVGLFLDRSPSADYGIGREFAGALARAGVPP